MPIPKNKPELIEAIESNFAKLFADLETIPENQTQLKELPGHQKDTSMSVANLVAYLIGWGELVLKWHRKDLANEPIDFPDTGYQWNELGQLAQKFYQDYQSANYPELLTHLQQTNQEILQVIHELDNHDLYGRDWYKNYPFGRMIQLNTSSPYKNARARVRKWKKAKINNDNN